MNIYFDTSSIAKLFFEEEGSALVTQYIENSENNIWILELTRLELISAVLRRTRENLYTEPQAQILIESIEDQCKLWHTIPISGATFKMAGEFLMKSGKEYRLRSLDALQFAGFVLIVTGEDWCFSTSDQVLVDIAKKYGFVAINPIQPLPK